MCIRDRLEEEKIAEIAMGVDRCGMPILTNSYQKPTDLNMINIICH